MASEISHKSNATLLTDEQERLLCERGYFLYQGFHFKPVGQFPKQEDTIYKIVRHLKRDDELGIREDGYYGKAKHPYSYDEFYQASPVKNADIFFCLETQKEYVPCQCDLQEYIREPDRKQDRGRVR